MVLGLRRRIAALVRRGSSPDPREIVSVHGIAVGTWYRCDLLVPHSVLDLLERVASLGHRNNRKSDMCVSVFPLQVLEVTVPLVRVEARQDSRI